jgi:hypothetical protein
MKFVFCRVPSEGEDDPKKAIVMEMTIHNEFIGDVNEIEEGRFVSFKFTGHHTYGVERPVNPKIYCVRKDMSGWDEVLQTRRRETHNKPSVHYLR